MVSFPNCNLTIYLVLNMQQSNLIFSWDPPIVIADKEPFLHYI